MQIWTGKLCMCGRIENYDNIFGGNRVIWSKMRILNYDNAFAHDVLEVHNIPNNKYI